MVVVTDTISGMPGPKRGPGSQGCGDTEVVTSQRGGLAKRRLSVFLEQRAVEKQVLT